MFSDASHTLCQNAVLTSNKTKHEVKGWHAFRLKWRDMSLPCVLPGKLLTVGDLISICWPQTATCASLYRSNVLTLKASVSASQRAEPCLCLSAQTWARQQSAPPDLSSLSRRPPRHLAMMTSLVLCLTSILNCARQLRSSPYNEHQTILFLCVYWIRIHSNTKQYFFLDTIHGNAKW